MNRGNMVPQKAICIALTVLLCFSISATNALADVCCKEEGCLHCPIAEHKHGAMAGSSPFFSGCEPGVESIPCGFENSKSSLGLVYIVFTTGMANRDFSDIPSGAADDSAAGYTVTGFPSRPYSRTISPSFPIYLKNLSLLC